MEQKPTRKEKAAETKRKIFETAVRLIKEIGYNNVTISEICKAAGVAKGSFYVHYNSKEDIEIDFDIPEECPFCKETFNKSELEEHEKVCPQNPENQKPVEPEKPTDTTKEPNNNSKEEIEWDVDDLYCPNCGEFSMGYHECKNNYFDVESGDPNSKEDIEIEIPLNDNTEQIAILETEVIEAERIASEARAEADRLTAIATEKRAALEALRQ